MEISDLAADGAGCNVERLQRIASTAPFIPFVGLPPEPDQRYKIDVIATLTFSSNAKKIAEKHLVWFPLQPARSLPSTLPTRQLSDPSSTVYSPQSRLSDHHGNHRTRPPSRPMAADEGATCCPILSYQSFPFAAISLLICPIKLSDLGFILAPKEKSCQATRSFRRLA
jgi:hypothetical protein